MPALRISKTQITIYIVNFAEISEILTRFQQNLLLKIHLNVARISDFRPQRNIADGKKIRRLIAKIFTDFEHCVEEYYI